MKSNIKNKKVLRDCLLITEQIEDALKKSIGNDMVKTIFKDFENVIQHKIIYDCMPYEIEIDDGYVNLIMPDPLSSEVLLDTNGLSSIAISLWDVTNYIHKTTQTEEIVKEALTGFVKAGGIVKFDNKYAYKDVCDNYNICEVSPDNVLTIKKCNEEAFINKFKSYIDDKISE